MLGWVRRILVDLERGIRGKFEETERDVVEGEKRKLEAHLFFPPSLQTSMTLPQLPYELIEEIVRHSSGSSLLSWCLVSHDFLDIAGSILYETVSILSSPGSFVPSPNCHLSLQETSPGSNSQILPAIFTASRLSLPRREANRRHPSNAP